MAGIDRLHLHKPLAVKDLLSAVSFAVQPLDDLNLAALLVSLGVRGRAAAQRIVATAKDAGAPGPDEVAPPS